MKSSCVQHPANHKLIIMRQWQVEFCDGDHCAAALLSFFEYWHNIRLDMSQKAREMNQVAERHGDSPAQDDSLCQFHTAEQLQAGLLNLYGEKKIREARQLLVRKGIIAEFPNPNPRYKFDKTLFFLFYPERINAWLAEHYPDSSPPAGSGAAPAFSPGSSAASRRRASSQACTSSASSPCGSLRSGSNTTSNGKNADGAGKNADGAGKNAGTIPETTPEITSETTTTTTHTPTLSPTGSNTNASTTNRSSCCHPSILLNQTTLTPYSRETHSNTPPIQPPIQDLSQDRTIDPLTDASPSLLFDFNLATLSQAEQNQLNQRLARLPHPLAQQVLDEYNHAIGRKMTFRVSRQAWLESLIRAAEADRFIPTSDLAERRQAQTITVTTTAHESPKRQASTAWQKGCEQLQKSVAPGEFITYIGPLRATEDANALWLEAPNTHIADWVKAHLPMFEGALRPHTERPLRVCIN